MLTVNPKEAQAAIDGKVPLEYLEPVALLAEAPVMKHGADKYGKRNYRDTPMKMTVYVGAIQRHTLAWAMGEDTDPESGFSHLAHIRACCAVMLGAIDAGTAVDDRLDATSTPRSDAVHIDGDQDAKAGLTPQYERGLDELGEELATEAGPFVVQAECCQKDSALNQYCLTIRDSPCVYDRGPVFPAAT